MEKKEFTLVFDLAVYDLICEICQKENFEHEEFVSEETGDLMSKVIGNSDKFMGIENCKVLDITMRQWAENGY